MSDTAVQDLLVRIATEPDLVAEIQADPDLLTSRFGLSPDEAARIAATKIDGRAAVPRQLEERLSRSGGTFGTLVAAAAEATDNNATAEAEPAAEVDEAPMTLLPPQADTAEPDPAAEPAAEVEPEVAEAEVAEAEVAEAEVAEAEVAEAEVAETEAAETEAAATEAAEPEPAPPPSVQTTTVDAEGKPVNVTTTPNPAGGFTQVQTHADGSTSTYTVGPNGVITFSSAPPPAPEVPAPAAEPVPPTDPGPVAGGGGGGGSSDGSGSFFTYDETGNRVQTTFGPDGTGERVYTSPDGTTTHFTVQRAPDGSFVESPEPDLITKPDGSTVKTVSAYDGVASFTYTETTAPDGTVTEDYDDGSWRTTATDPNGNRVETTMRADGVGERTIHYRDGGGEVWRVEQSEDGTVTEARFATRMFIGIDTRAGEVPQDSAPVAGGGGGGGSSDGGGGAFHTSDAAGNRSETTVSPDGSTTTVTVLADGTRTDHITGPYGDTTTRTVWTNGESMESTRHADGTTETVTVRADGTRMETTRGADGTIWKTHTVKPDGTEIRTSTEYPQTGEERVVTTTYPNGEWQAEHFTPDGELRAFERLTLETHWWDDSHTWGHQSSTHLETEYTADGKTDTFTFNNDKRLVIEYRNGPDGYEEVSRQWGTKPYFD